MDRDCRRAPGLAESDDSCRSFRRQSWLSHKRGGRLSSVAPEVIAERQQEIRVDVGLDIRIVKQFPPCLDLVTYESHRHFPNRCENAWSPCDRIARHQG